VARLAPKALAWAVMVALLLQVMTLTAAFQGHPWQIDSHMIYFAALAVVSIMQNMKVLIAAAAFIAVHHVLMALTMPLMIYPEASTNALGRTIFHAVVVVAETAILGFAIYFRQKNRSDFQLRQTVGEEARAVAVQAEAKAQQERERAAQTVAVMTEHLREIAQSNLTANIVEPFPAEYDAMRTDYNNAIANLCQVLGSAMKVSSEFRAEAENLLRDANTLRSMAGDQAKVVEQTATGLKELLSLIHI